MDTPTQAVLGAALGQAFWGRTLGRKALLWGAVAGMIPDLDIVAAAWTGPWGEVLYHRGPTHALWFGPVAGAALGYGAWTLRIRCRKNQAEESPMEPDIPKGATQGSSALTGPGRRRSWMWLFVLVLFTHPLLDLFTSYGTQLLWPLTRHRFAIHAVSIVDPAYTGILVVSLLFGLWKGVRSAPARRAALLALAFSTAYLFYGALLNGRAESEVRRQLAQEGLEEARVRCYPTLLQVFLRRAVVWTPEEVRVGLISMWSPSAVAWERFPVSRGPWVDAVRTSEAGRIFEWFALGDTVAQTRIESGRVIVEITDLRYGFPGRTASGFWGIRAVFDENGNKIGDVARFRRYLPETRQALSLLWRATFVPRGSER